jgi:hypothetical protein
MQSSKKQKLPVELIRRLFYSEFIHFGGNFLNTYTGGDVCYGKSFLCLF